MHTTVEVYSKVTHTAQAILRQLHLGEPWVLERGSCREPFVGVASEQAAEYLESFLGQLRLGEHLAQ